VSWISTLNAWQWALLGAVPAIILLMYFLKLRREVVEVPSTYLWARTIEDLHVNSLLQRLRRSVLLFLQMLAVLLAALALLRPGVRGESTSQSRLVFMIDRSASMQATDVKDDPSRFALAKRLVAERIEAMQDTESAMLIAFDSRAEVMQTFTTDRGRLRDALDRIEVSDRTTDLLSALRAADGLAGAAATTNVESEDPTDGANEELAAAKRIEPAILMLYSDGGFPSVAEVELNNLVPQFVAIGSTTPNNLAVTAFSAERNPDRPSELQTFATISNLEVRVRLPQQHSRSVESSRMRQKWISNLVSKPAFRSS
jgi:von Willebrand factor type A domain/Aerotolerance regulator N-terminal